MFLVEKRMRLQLLEINLVGLLQMQPCSFNTPSISNVKMDAPSTNNVSMATSCMSNVKTSDLVMQPLSSVVINVEEGKIFFFKNDANMCLSMLETKDNYEIRVQKSNISLYSVRCVHD